MKKILSIVALMAVLLFISSAYNHNDGLAIGDKAPEFNVSNGSGRFVLKECDSEYVLLTFWSTSDAQSRIDCNNYSHWARQTKRPNVKHIAINFDSYPELFDEVVRIDKFDKQAQYNVNGEQADILRLDYGLIDGYGSLLIGPDGRIMAFNPTDDVLSSLNVSESLASSN